MDFTPAERELTEDAEHPFICEHPVCPEVITENEYQNHSGLCAKHWMLYPNDQEDYINGK